MLSLYHLLTRLGKKASARNCLQKPILGMLLCILSLFSAAFDSTPAFPPKITLSVPEESAVEGREIPLYITILHSPQDKIDETSFLYDDMPFKVTSIQKDNVAPEALFKGKEEEGIAVSRYVGMLPAKKPGLYSVGPVSVIINKIRFDSGAISVNVQAAVTSDVLRLEILPRGESKIFPGQEVTLGYRIYYQKAIELTREDLPLLNVKGFLNSGSPVITTQNTQEGGVQTIVQKARAEQPGTYSILKSVIEGLEIENTEGEKTLIGPLYRSSVNPMTVTILPFPEKDRPPAFDGALGSFVWRGASLDGTAVKVGQAVHIEYRVSGRGDLSTVKFPSFDQISGLQDSFWTESLPPVGKEDDGVKVFILIVRPKRPGRLEAPGFFTYSFDPVSERYLTATVAPLPLSVEGKAESETVAPTKAQEQNLQLAPPYELKTPVEKTAKLSFHLVLIVIVVFILVAVAEVLLRKKLQKEVPVTSQKLFYVAIAKRARGYEALKLIKNAFYRRLFEVGLTTKIEEDPDVLSDEGLVGEVKGYLKSVDVALYRRDVAAEGLASFFEEAIGLYQKLKYLQTIK